MAVNSSINNLNQPEPAVSGGDNLKRKPIKCPYCGAHAAYRPAAVVYGESTFKKSADTYLYVCSRWPSCDTYVSAHKKSKKPMGTLANRELRHKRMLAHQSLNAVGKHYKMEKQDLYIWLQAKMAFTEEQTHIAMFSEYRCDQVIALCDQTMKPAACC